MMKNKNVSAIVTLLAAFFIIASGFLSIKYYSEHRKEATLGSQTELDMNFNPDESLESVIFDSPWKNKEWSEAEKTIFPVKYKAVVSEICGIFQVSENKDDTMYKINEKEYLMKYTAGEQKIYIYINEENNEFSFMIDEKGETAGDEKKSQAEKELEKQKENKNSEMYRLLVDLSQSLCKNGFLTLGSYDESEVIQPEYMKEDLIQCENTIFSHGDKVYSVFLPTYIFENNNFISLVYDYQTEKFCGCKFRIVEYS